MGAAADPLVLKVMCPAIIKPPDLSVFLLTEEAVEAPHQGLEDLREVGGRGGSIRTERRGGSGVGMDIRKPGPPDCKLVDLGRRTQGTVRPRGSLPAGRE